MKKTMIFIFSMMMTGFTFAGGYELGDKADDFLLKNVDGTMISMSKYQDVKGFIVIFTCNHCPYSKAYEDRIIALDKKYKSEGFPVLAINPNDPELVPEDSFENMKINAKEKGFTFPYLFDADQKVYPLYGATRTPHVFLLNKEEGDLIVRYIGAIDNNHTDASKVTESYLEDAVDALLEGGTPDPGYTKAIGCSIKNKASKK